MEEPVVWAEPAAAEESLVVSAAGAEEGEDKDGTAGNYWDDHSEPLAAGEACTEWGAAHWDL